jgi:glutamate-1-semialdehyde 2,1-aminomutase
MSSTQLLRNEDAIERGRRCTAAEGYDIGTRFPAVFASAEGSWMRDVEGNRVLDVTAASGSLLLGNQHPRVVEAIHDCVRNYGAAFASTLSPQRIELAERLCSRYPAGEKAVFFRTGSDATTAAIRLARAYTGRDLIFTSGYHGWHDWQLTYLQMGYDAANRVANFGYNETALTHLLENFGADVAGVIVTPEPAWLDAAYFRRLSELCAKHGVVFILDEVITGLRYGPRGVNGSGEVRADLITMSKGLANGHALAPVLGRREIIDCYDRARLAGTYTRELTPMAAALAVLDVIADGGVHEHCAKMGRLLKEGMGKLFSSLEIPAYISGPDMMFDVVLESERLSAEIYRAAFDHGAYFEDSGTHMVTAAFTESEVNHALVALEKGARHVLASGGIARGQELPPERRLQFPRDAFGGNLRDDDSVAQRTRAIAEQIAMRTRSPQAELDPACS